MQRVLTERSERKGGSEDFKCPCWKTGTGFGKQDSEVTLPADRFIYKWKYIASGGLDFELDQRLERNEK